MDLDPLTSPTATPGSLANGDGEAAGEVGEAQSTVTSRTIAVEHIKIESRKKFEEVQRALEETIPKLNPAVGEFLRNGDQDRARVEEEHGPKLSIFLDRDHGALLQIAGGTRNARQYEIGNPLTASKMTRHQLPAALYARFASSSTKTATAGGYSNTTGPLLSSGSSVTNV
jgi:hypothetical protein